jgi:predicted dehydrogenase
MNAVPRIGLGVIGVGVAAWTGHLPAAEESQDFQILALLDVDQVQLQRTASRFAVPNVCSNADELYAIPGLQAVVIATPTASHSDLAEVAISRRKHVLLEKPMARTVEECSRLTTLATDHEVVLAIGHEKRFHPTFQRVRELLAGGVIGQPYYCGVHWASCAKMDPANFVPEGFYQGYRWRWEDPAAGGGILQDHLPHYLDLLRYWTGDEPRAIYAQTVNVARDLLRWSPDASVWEDFAVVLIRFSSGLLLRFETGTVGRSLSPIWSLGSGLGEWTEYAYVLGSEGQLLFDMLPWDSSENGRIALWRREKATREGLGWTYVEQPEPIRRRGSPAGAAAQMFGAQLRAWACAIRGEPSQIATGRDGMITVAAVEAAYQAARLGRECDLSLHSEMRA